MKTEINSTGQEGPRTQRYFSEELKRRIVQQINNRLIGVSEVSRTYNVSRTAVYAWRQKYSASHVPEVRQVVELESEALANKKLREHIAELERLLGRKQLVIEVLEAVIEQGSDSLGIDIKKKFGMPSSSGSGSSADGEAQ